MIENACPFFNTRFRSFATPGCSVVREPKFSLMESILRVSVNNESLACRSLWQFAVIGGVLGNTADERRVVT